jgi:hypothetical protein
LLLPALLAVLPDARGHLGRDARLLNDRVALLIDLIDVYGRLGELHAQELEGLGDDPRDGKIAEPFVVRGNDAPRGVIGAALAQRGLEGRRVGIPEGPLGVVAVADLPVTVGAVDPLLEAREFLAGIDVELGFEDVRTGVVEQFLEVVDVTIAFGPHLFRHYAVHPRDEDVLVV